MTNQIETYYFVTRAGVEFAAMAIPASIQGPNARRAPAGRGQASVEFYDMRFPSCAREGEPGQYVASYRLDTIVGSPDALDAGDFDGTTALMLSGDEPDWIIDAASMLDVSTWLATIKANRWLE